MARVQNEKQYEQSRLKLLEAGMALFRASSFDAVGINKVLKVTGIPKGSFYHYFDNKEAFGLQVAEFYHDLQLQSAREILHDTAFLPLSRLRRFFRFARKEYRDRNYADGCLMCNLSTELGYTNEAFQKLLKTQWAELSDELCNTIALIDKKEIGLMHLSDKEAADWMLNAWSGALTRMKAERSDKPLKLFEKTLFT